MGTVDIKRVIVVSKTHLDIGFTDYAANVLKKYTDDFIPKSVELAFQLNTQECKRFVWTTGAYLIRYALRNSTEENKERLREAIRLGYVRYHALPLTTHTELMSSTLFRYGLSISKELDAEFGLHTVASKMTDVPGHTIAIVPLMAETGIRYLHLGVNASSRVPKTPDVFRWRMNGKEIVVSYNGDYAAPLVLKNGTVLEMLHTHDNFGPPTVEEIDAFYEDLYRKYPHAEISAGTLDDFALAIEEVWDDLPIVEEEIGDTWIHGTASDPVKTSALKRLLRLTDGWLDNGKLVPGTPAYDMLMENLLLVTEHTWGMDVKKYLLDFTNWEKKDFLRALQANKTDYSFYGKVNEAIFAGMKHELDLFRESEISSYSFFAESHQEQRDYIKKALKALPEDCRSEAEQELAWTYPDDMNNIPFIADHPFKCNDWLIIFGKNGEVTHLANAHLGICKDLTLGKFCYQSFSGGTVKNCYYSYGRDLDVNFHWAECDFGKPGLEYCPTVRDTITCAVPVSLKTETDRITVFMRGDTESCTDYGCPDEIAAEYRFTDDDVELTLYWRGKDPIRSPEALWLGFNMRSSNSARTQLKKLGTSVSPLNIISGGNRKLHAVEEVSCNTATDSFAVTPIDAPVVSIGGRHLYDVDDGIEDPGNGFYFLLCNNRWGTNFPQWFNEDARFKFKIELH